MRKLNQILILSLFVTLMGCDVSPQPIDYGKEACHFCKMTIVDKLHAAEIVTTKGKVYKFDSTECMIHFLEDFDTSTIKLYLSNNYSEPGTLIDATQAAFLISENIPSPMGANLSAFKTKTQAENFQKEKGGTLYSWEELLNHLK
ncbi:MAG TPA: nitrous oxide reductase accessory protein NosL [Flavobacteriaceae bacterium]|nr:nitrous oxide reductase accessory protein NosL [Flavobacteriaceae bacterium]